MPLNINVGSVMLLLVGNGQVQIRMRLCTTLIEYGIPRRVFHSSSVTLRASFGSKVGWVVKRLAATAVIDQKSSSDHS